jgi:membrane protease YdiL (CAAX protease family)
MLVVTAREFFSFLKNPHLDKSPKESTLFKLRYLLQLFLIELPLMGLILLLMFLLYEYGFITESTDPLRQLRGLIYLYGYPLILLLIIIALPFGEEVIFRSYLTWPRFFKQRFLIAHFGWLFYASAILFALAHIPNIPDEEINVFIPFLIAPQFCGGLFNGYLRIKFGLLWGFLFHALHNSCCVGLLVAFGGLPSF